MVHPDDRERIVHSAERAWTTGADWDDEYRMIAANGQIVWIRDLARCVRRLGQDGSFRFVGMVMDVTERRLETDRLTKRLASMDALHSGIEVVLWTWVLDPATDTFRYTYYSPQTMALVGYAPEELMAERDHFTRLIHPDDLDRVKEIDARSDETGIWDATYRVVHRDGTPKWIRSRGWRGTGPEPEEIVWHGVAYEVAVPDEAAEVAGGGAAEAAPPTEVTPRADVRPPA
jgi:PAS domain-containing protein